MRIFVSSTFVDLRPERDAEGYLKSGDMKKAQENYEKALMLDPKNNNAKESLKKIKEMKER